MMHKSDAVARINEGLGFRSLSETIIVRRMVEAQRELEKGKTLPFFLVQEDASIVLQQGTREIPLPTGFIREYDDGQTWTRMFLESQQIPIRKVDLNSLLILDVPTTPGPPKYYTIRTQSLYFGRFADQNYTLAWSYYAKADDLLVNDTNVWLDDVFGAPEWLIGEAGLRLATDLRDQNAVALFQAMATKARAALLGEIVAQDDVPLSVGGNL